MGGTMVDLCEGGIGFRVIMPLLDESGPVKVSFSLDANSLLEANGEVAWSDATKQSGGVRFTNIRDDVRAQLRDFLAKSILPVQPSEPVFSPAFNGLTAPLSGKPAQPPANKAVPSPAAPGPVVVAPKVAPPPSTAAEAPPPKRAVPMKPRTTPATMPFINPAANQPAAQAASQPSTNPASIPDFEAPASKQSPVADQLFERAPRYETPDEYSPGAPGTSRPASDSLLGKVQEIRPSRVAPPAQPTPAQAPPDMARRMAAAASASAMATSAGPMASAAQIALPPAAVTRPNAPAQKVSAPASTSPSTSAPPAAKTQPPVAGTADTAAPPMAAASAASPSPSFKLPPAMSSSLASAEQYWRTTVLDPAKDLYQNREKFLSRLPEELRNKQFVGRTAGAGVVTAFVILLLLTTYNYFKSARATSAQSATQVAQTQSTQHPAITTLSATTNAAPAAAATDTAAPPASTASTKRSNRTERASIATVSEPSSGRTAARSSSARSDALPTSEAVQADTTGNAELQLARHYLDSPDDQNVTLAIQWLWSSVKKGNTQADMLLADMYLRGQSVPQNCEQSRVLLLAAANSGSTLARQRLANLDAEGCPAHSAQN